MVTFESFLKDPIKYAPEITTKQLANFLRKLSIAYYNQSASLISDDDFDKLKDILEERDPNNEFLGEIGAPIDAEKVKLPYPMGSLNKIKYEEEKSSKFKKEIENWTKTYHGEYVLSDKMDGISALIHKKADEMKLYTRGDGLFGQDVTHLLKYIKIDTSKMPIDVAIRGELIMTRKNFEKIKDKMANARNAVAGIVNSKTTDKNMVKLVDFITYSVVYPHDIQEKQFELLTKWGFKTAQHKIVKKISVDVLLPYLKERRSESLYDIDGIVVIDSGMAYPVMEGNPKYGFAFKAVLDDQIAVATVVDVEWEISRYGYIKPRVRIEPIKLVGVTITYATAHNAKFIQDNNIGVGAKIKLIRSGDVIPKIMEVIKPAKKPKMPDIEYEWNETGVDIIAINKDDSKTITTIKQITNFVTTLGVDYISEGIVTKLVDGGIDTILKLLKVKPEKMAEIIGDKVTEKVLNNLDSALKKTTLPEFMTASNCFGRGLGTRKCKVITKAYPNIMKEKWNDDVLKEKILKLEGFQDKTADKFIEGFVDFKKFFNDVMKIVDISYLIEPDTINVGDKFKDMKIVMTGFRDSDMEDFITKNGGNVTTSVSKNTSFVISTDNAEMTGKLAKAEELGVKIMTRSEFTKKYMR